MGVMFEPANDALYNVTSLSIIDFETADIPFCNPLRIAQVFKTSSDAFGFGKDK